MKAGRERSGQCLGLVSEAVGRLADAFKGTAQSILSWYRLTAKNQPTEITDRKSGCYINTVAQVLGTPEA